MDHVDRVRFLVNRYLNNRCTREEMEEVLAYMRQHPDDKDLLDVLGEPWNTGDDIEEDTMPSWHDMQKRISAAKHRRLNRKWLWRIAACLAPLAAVAAGFLLFRDSPVNAFTANASDEVKSITTTKSEHRLVVLSDGSRVWINGHSRLVSPKEFGTDTREVTLEGEAFFDIRHDLNRPFIIITGAVKTTVLGTAFNIRAFPDEGEVTVTVTRGQVRVDAENTLGKVIGANEQIRLDLPTEKVQSASVDAATITRWTEEDLILHEITLAEMEEILEERYAVDIRFDNAQLKNCRFTSTFFKHAALDDILTSICLVNGASYERGNDGVVTIYGQGCP